MIERLSRRPAASLWLLVVLPFVVLPLVFISGLVVPPDALWGHAVFHLVYLPVIVLALLVVARARSASTSRAVRVLLALLLLALTAAALGHVGELVVTATEGMFSAPASVFEDHRHVFFANFAVFGLMAAALLGIVTSVVLGVQHVRARREQRRVPAAV